MQAAEAIDRDGGGDVHAESFHYVPTVIDGMVSGGCVLALL